MKENIYETILREMKSSGYILDRLLPNEAQKNISSDEIIKILESAYPLTYNNEDDSLKYIDENGLEHIAPDLSDGITISSGWLCDKLPLPFIDFDQGGNIRKIEEARAIYTIVCIGIVLPTFKQEIIEMINLYDFNKMAFKDEDSAMSSMTAYLNSYLDMNSMRINVIASSAAIQISRAIEKKDIYWKSSLTLEEITEFGRISRECKNVILRYERERKLNPTEITKMSRIQKLITIQDRDLEINAIIENSVCSMLYKISKLNSERLSPIVKRKIYLSAQLVARNYVNEIGLQGREADEKFEKKFSEISRDLTRMAVTTLRSNEIDKYKSNPSSYKFRKKV